MTTFYNNYVTLCAKNKKSLSAVAEEVGLSRTSPNGWKKGKHPSDVTLRKLADYFGVPVEALTAETKKEPAPVSELSCKEQLFNLIDRMSREELVEALQIISKKL